MKQLIIFFAIILIAIILCRCDLGDRYSMTILNNANHSIGFYLLLGSWMCYPDTLLPDTDFSVAKNLKSGSWTKILAYRRWEEVVTRLSGDTMSVFIFHSDTLNKYSWEEIRSEYMILRRYDLSSDDIVTLFNEYRVPEIPYPPDNRMRNMKMWPPYGK